MSVPTSVAINAYSNLLRTAANTEQKQVAENTTNIDTNFTQVLKDTVDDVIESGKESSKAIIDNASGKAGIVDVVTAVAETEVAVQTLVSVRDRMISAYQEILRMPI